MARAIDVADFIIQESNRLGHPVTNLELQKYMYFCHARSLVDYDKPLIEDEKIEKWRYGPVSEIAYHEYKNYGVNSIIEPDTHLKFNQKTSEIEISNFDESNLTSVEKKLIRKTVEKLKQYSGFELVDMTHEHNSWRKDEEAILNGVQNLEYKNDDIKSDFINNKGFRIWEVK